MLTGDADACRVRRDAEGAGIEVIALCPNDQFMEHRSGAVAGDGDVMIRPDSDSGGGVEAQQRRRG